MLSSKDPLTFKLGDRIVNRIGYGTMQLAGPGAFGPPKDRKEAVALLREAVENGVNHIDTSDFYGPHVTNAIIREALHPYFEDLTIVTKVGAMRGLDGSWRPAFSREGWYRRCMTTYATSASTCSMWSTCAPCSARTDLQRDLSKPARGPV